MEKEKVTKDSEVDFYQCWEIARNAVKSQPQMPFKDSKEMSLITLYTSSVQVIEGQTSVRLYQNLNASLR